MPVIGRINEFDVVSGSWNTYIERVDQYFVANEVGDGLKVATLIACVGDATYELMVDLCAPKKPKDMKFVDVVEIVRKHIQPTPSLLAERYKFRKRVQEKEETVAQFAAALKHLGRTCVFKDKLEENLRDQFVCGLSSEIIRQRLFCEGDPTYGDSYKLAISLEAAAKDAAAVEQQVDVTEGAVQALRAGPSGRGRGGGGGQRRRAFANGGTTGSGGPRAGGTGAYHCFSCGSRSHVKSSCKFKEYTCRICLERGHLARQCERGGQGRGDRQVLQLERGAGDEPPRAGWRTSSSGDGEYGASAGAAPGGEDGPDGLYMLRLRDSGPPRAGWRSDGRDGDYCASSEGGPGGLHMVRLRGSEPIIADVEVAGRRVRPTQSEQLKQKPPIPRVCLKLLN